MKTILILLTTILLTSTFAEDGISNPGSYLCAENSDKRLVVRAVSGYGIVLSGFSGHNKTYYDVDFDIIEETENIDSVFFHSDIQSPDGDETNIILSVNLNDWGNDETARWLGIEFFPRSTDKHFAGTISINGKSPTEATCIKL